MLNTMIVVKMTKTNYTEWKKLFDGNAEIVKIPFTPSVNKNIRERIKNKN